MGISVYNSSPRNNKILGPKKGNKKKTSLFSSIFLGKSQFLFQQSQKGQLTSPFFKKSEEIWLGLWVKHQQNPSSFTPVIFESPFFFHPGSLHSHRNQKHFHLPTFFHLTISYKSKS